MKRTNKTTMEEKENAFLKKKPAAKTRSKSSFDCPPPKRRKTNFDRTSLAKMCIESMHHIPPINSGTSIKVLRPVNRNVQTTCFTPPNEEEKKTSSRKRPPAKTHSNAPQSKKQRSTMDTSFAENCIQSVNKTPEMNKPLNDPALRDIASVKNTSANECKATPLSNMEKAINAVANGVSYASAAKQYQVDRNTLMRKIKGISPVEKKTGGPATQFTKEEEDRIEKWVIDSAKRGFPITKAQLIERVSILVIEFQKKDPKRNFEFADGTPGRHWYERFMKRHPKLTHRTPQNLTKSRSVVSKENIRTWHVDVDSYFLQEKLTDVLNDPRRCFNGDEAAFFLTPKGDIVLAGLGQKNVYAIVTANERECLTVIITGNANGDLAPPMIIYAGQRLLKDIINSIPPDWGYGKSESGWMTKEVFYEYLGNVYLPWLVAEKVKRPVAVFVDGHTSHQSYETSLLCEENGIILISLYPNSTHICQPMDVAVFKPLKAAWKSEVSKWRQENFGIKLSKVHFAPIFARAIKKGITPETLQNGFRHCGIYPWDFDAIDFSRLPNTESIDIVSPTSHENEILTSCLLSHLEKHMGRAKLEIFESVFDETKPKDIIKREDIGLFEYWVTLRPKNSDSSTETGVLNNSEQDNNEPKNQSVTEERKETETASCQETVLIDFENTNMDEIINALPLTLVEHENLDELSTKELLNYLHKPLDENFLNPKPGFSGEVASASKKSETSCVTVPAVVQKKSFCDDSTAIPQTVRREVTSSEALVRKSSPPEKIISSFVETEHGTLEVMPISSESEMPDHTTSVTVEEVSTRLSAWDKLISVNVESDILNTSISKAVESELPDKVDQNALALTSSSSKKVTPTKSTNLDPDSPSPFSKVFFFPKPKPSTKEKTTEKVTERIPVCASSQAYRDFIRRKAEKIAALAKLRIEKRAAAAKLREEKKAALEKLREERKLQRLAAAEEKKKTTKRPQKNGKKPVKRKLKFSILRDMSADEDEEAQMDRIISETQDQAVAVGLYVIIKYEGEYFPGIVLKVDEKGAEVKVMQMAGDDWRWPAVDDILYYERSDIVQVIDVPTLLNARGYYAVPAISALRKRVSGTKDLP